MKKIAIQTSFTHMLSDIYTPVGIYLRLRDRFRDTILLESTDYQAGENSFSFIGINAIAGIEITNKGIMEAKLPGQAPYSAALDAGSEVSDLVWKFMQRFDIAPKQKGMPDIQGLFGYTCFDAVQFFDNYSMQMKPTESQQIPLMRYRLYQYVIAINHYKDELFICENKVAGLDSELEVIQSLISSKDVPVYPFKPIGAETSNITDEAYKVLVQKGIDGCLRGDTFQIVLSRRFQQSFTGDEFNVYRALRSINPSPYLFFFDYGEYKLMGSSPESQLVIKNGTAIMHPIAGTFKRTGEENADAIQAAKLQQDEKENAEHVMLVDLARNDLSKSCQQVTVKKYKGLQYYSHVIHLVSEVTGNINPGANPFTVLSNTFPAGTLSGAPKFKAIENILNMETTSRSFYGGCIGFVGFDGNFNQAIMIRTLLSKNNTLFYQAGAGVVAASQPTSELEEVNNKLAALKQAIQKAATL